MIPYMYVGLDLSLTGTGIIVLHEDGRIAEECVEGRSLKRSATVQDKIERQIEIASKIVGVIRSKTVDKRFLLGIENYAYNARGSQNDLGELHGVVRTQLWLIFGVAPVMVPVTTARKGVLGKGNIKKADVRPMLESRTGHVFVDHNTVDAYVIAEYLRKKELAE